MSQRAGNVKLGQWRRRGRRVAEIAEIAEIGEIGTGQSPWVSKVFAEVAEHVGPVGFDFFSRWSLPVFGEHAALRFERNTI